MSSYDEKPWLKHYDSGLEPELVVPETNYADMFIKTARDNPDAPAIHFMGVTLSYETLDDLSGRFAAYLSLNGCAPGDVVGINLPNLPQYLIALIGALRCGCAATGVSPLLTATEMAYQLNDSHARVLVTLDAIFEHRVQEIRDELPHLKQLVVTSVGDFLPAIKRVLGRLLKKIPSGKVEPIPGKHVLSFQQVLKGYAPDIPPVRILPEDTCLLQYTGGTTGVPKGTELTHRNIVANIEQVIKWLGIRGGRDVMCSAFPLFHLAGLMVGMISIAKNIPQCLIPDPRNTRHICGEIKKYQPTLLTNVPSLYQMLMEEPEFRTLDFASCKICVSGAAPFAVESIEAFEAIVGKGKVMEVYGMTETSPILTANPYLGRKKIGSVGIPVQSTRIKLVDIETGTQEVAVGEEGELIARGPQVMKGYLNKPEETAHALREFQGEKWLYTGDVARMDTDGYFTIADRVKDMLIVGGYKVFSREVEEILYQHPAVEFCAIVGLPNRERPGTDIVKAVIQRAKDAAESDTAELKKQILHHCRENMAPYKVPKLIEFTDVIPLTAVGKVDKKALR
jgi:acyl-CoA synthetase (AMP-forming)/AMP-acid ligase II